MSNNEIELKKKILNSFGIHLYLAEKLIDKGYEVSSTSLTLRMGGFQLEKNGEIFDCTINILPNSEKSEYKLGFHLSNHPLKGPIEVMINALREKGLDIISSVIDTTSYTPSSYIIFSIKGQEPKVKVLLFPTGVLMDRSMPFMKFKPIKEVVKELYEQELKKSEKEQGKKERQNFSQEIDIDENLKNEIIDFRGVELSKYEATIIEHIEYLLDEKYHKAVMLKHSGRHTYDIRDQKIVGLRLDWEDLTKLPEVVLKLEYLEDLWLGANKLQKLPNSFRAIKNLKKLRLSRNKLDHIPDCIFSLSSLTKLDLTENKIEFIPPHIAKLQSLRSLFLASNNLVSIPEELFTITNLKTLYLSGNPIRDLSSTIQNLESLENLSFGSYSVPLIPKSIALLKNLKHLSLACQNSRGIPEEICNLSSVEWLSIAVDQLTTLPKQMENLISVETIDLHSERGTSLPFEISKLPALKRIYFTGDIANVIIQGFKRDSETVKTLYKLEDNGVNLYIP